MIRIRHAFCVSLAAALLGGAPAVRSAVPGADAPLPEPGQLKPQAALPDPLAMLDGTRIENRQAWFERRRPELKRLFQHYMYGNLPPAPPRVTARVERTDPAYFGGKATKKEIVIQFGPAQAPTIQLLLVTPNAKVDPAPVFVGMNFCGNHTLVKDPTIALPRHWVYSRCAGVKDEKATDEGRGSQIDVWDLEKSIDRGYAVATFYSGDIDPDKPDFSDGVHPHYLAAGQKGPGPHDWGTIAAWAWGIHRAVDYLVTDADVDHRKIAVVGHSRLGKTALLAAAFDERIALAIPHQAGCGGTAPSRGKVGESVKRINDSFPHWFNDTFPLFNEQVDRLPFDQHCLVALCAPRPVLFSNAIEDTWANPDGQFEVLQAANPVYKLLGVEGLTAAQPPEQGKLVNSRLGYFIRAGKHSMTPEDWEVFRAFADRNLPSR